MARAPDDPRARLALARALARSGERAAAARACWRVAALGGPLAEVRAVLRGIDVPSSPCSQTLGDATNAQATHALGPRRGDRALRARTPGGSGRAAAVDEDGSIWVATVKAEVTRFTPALTNGYRNRVSACTRIAALATSSGGALASDGHEVVAVHRSRGPRGSRAQPLGTAAAAPFGIVRLTPGGLVVTALEDGRGFRTWRGAAWDTVIVDDGPRTANAPPLGPCSPLAAVQGDRVAFAHPDGPLFVCALDGRVVAWATSEGTWPCPPAFAADGTVLALALPAARPQVAVLQAFAPDGRVRWRRELDTRLSTELYFDPPSLALDPNGGAYVMLHDGLVRVDTEGAVEWRRPGQRFSHQDLRGASWLGGAAVGGDGVLYVMEHFDLVAIAPDGDELFRCDKNLRVVIGIDALERLLVFDCGQNLVAIGDTDGPAAELEPGPVPEEGDPINVAFLAW